MYDYTKHFDNFLEALQNKDLQNASIFLSMSFKENGKKTLSKLYKKLLYDKDAFIPDFSGVEMPLPYKILLGAIRDNRDEISEASTLIRSWSGEQLVQGAANVLEKKNAELKYNEAWNKKYTGGHASYLETERQAMYITTAGMQFQEILERYYPTAPTEPSFEIVWNAETEAQIETWFDMFSIHHSLKDVLEGYLFFNWTLEATDNRTLKVSTPEGLQESSSGRDLLNLLKSKTKFEDIDAIANNDLLNRYLEKQEPKPQEFWKYLPQTEKEKDWFSEATKISAMADKKAEQEFALFTEYYFPGLEEYTLILNDGTQLPIRDVFNITSFLAELSKTYIESIDLAYSESVNKYTDDHPLSKGGAAIWIYSILHKGDSKAIKKTLKENCNDEVREDIRQTIAFAKENIHHENCLIRLEHQKLANAMQWRFQYELEFIERVLNLFRFDPLHASDVTRTPLFSRGDKLLWMPNLVAYTSFAENLIENILSKKLMTLHRLQTACYETSLKNTFKAHGYKIIEDDKDKTMYINGIAQGDFDLLAWKDRHVILMQLKLTSTRNDYESRRSWKQDALRKAASQLKTCEEFIKNSPEHIKEILRLTPSEIVENVSSFIVSNSFLYDREYIDGYLKISCTEALGALKHVEYYKPYDVGNVERYVDFIRENKLFGNFEKLPSVTEVPLQLKNHVLIRSIVLPKNIYGNL